MLHHHTRGIALLLAIVMAVSMLPVSVFATTPSIGDTQHTHTNTPPAAVENAVWVLAESVECKKIEHTHTEKCYYQSCDHNNGHTSAGYSESTTYELCTHDSENPAHTGTGDLTDVVSISGTNVSWKTDHPAYPAIYAVYKAAYDEAYANAKYLKEMTAKAAGVAALVGKTFCYTVSTAATPDKCTHTCSEIGGSCYTKLCILEEHTHNEECFQYTWVLKSDINNNGIADDVDTYYTVKYVSDGEVVYEELVLVGMPTPTVAAPSKDADAQYTYTFAGWDTPVADKVTADATYTAVYTNAVNKYTVTWQDEDGTELELDKDVEYGKMPTYNGQLPTKQGDNTKVYTFAGWTPSVEVVTGNITYTATYSTQNVYKVSFVIGNEIKDEYVVDGETVQAYQPTKEHYKLSAWLDENGNEYDFSTPVTGDTVLTAKWRLAEIVFEIVAPNATHTLQQMVIPVGSTFSFDIIPDEGYVIESVVRNGNKITIHHDNGKVTIGGVTDVYEIDRFVVTTSKAALDLDSAEMNVFGDLSSESIFNAVYNPGNSNPSNLTAADVKVEYLAYSITLLNKTYDWWVVPGTDVSLENFLAQYGLGSLASYIPAEKLPHAFGTQNTESVRVSFAGNDKYPALSAETTVAMIDQRIPTSIVLNEGIKVTYGATAEDILKLVFNSITSDTARTVVSGDYKDVTIKLDSLNAGKRKATVTFGGNNTYAPSVAEVEVVIEKAEGIINMTPVKDKYGATITVPGMTQTNANFIEVAMGLKLGANASADAGTVIYVNIPSLIDVDAIENETVKKVVSKIINSLNEKMSGTMTIAELNESLNALLPYIESLENEGYSMNLSAEAINALSTVLTKLSEIDGVNSVALKVTVGQQVVLEDAGVYLVTGVIADPNYTTKFAASYAVITPDGLRAELDWNIKDENGLITIDALKNGYDLNASVSKVYEGNIADAEKHLYNVFFGVNKDGEFIFTRDQADLDLGAYTEVAFIVDLGNTMYYAEPIARAFIVTVDVANVQFVDKNGNENNDRIFEFGADATMNAVAYDRTTGKVLNGTMQYFYAGLQVNGELYRGTVAPSRPGTYTVIALFVSEDQSAIGSAIGALVIKPIDVEFSITDNTVQYDGNSHKVNIDAAFTKEILAVLDEQGNLNVVVPGVDFSEDVQASTIEAILAKLEGVEVPEELNTYYTELLAEVKAVFEEIRDRYDIKSVTLNGALPTEIGTYRFMVIGLTSIEHEVVSGKATLTIKCDHVYDHDCDVDCNLCGAEREVSKHKATYIDRFESTCVKHGYEKIRCKACHEVLSEKELPLDDEHVFYNGACLLCGISEKCEHDYVVVKELAPTCVEPGYVWKECSKCGEEYNHEVGEATGVHGDTYIDRFDSSCIKHGYEKTRCKNCDEVLSETELPLSNEHAFYNGVCLLCGAEETCRHNYETVRELEATCGEAGYVWTKCTKCGNEYNHEVGEPTGKHTFDNDCDAACNGCEFTREVGEHVYDNACDTDCNICGAERITTHVYDNACDAQCNICKSTREVGKHQYVGTETKAPECGAAGEKTYTCTECGHSYTEAVDATGDHTYDNNCDAECNNCKQPREVGEHVYTNACDDDCNECGNKRTPSEHVYDNACDANCNVCDEARVPAEHQYDNQCDTECNECGATREVGEHVYDNDCDQDCNACGATREVPAHVYDNACDTTCNVCEAEREVEAHKYSNACDTKCDVCEAEREVPAHVYDDEYDADCNECGATREVPGKPCEHEYDNDCDANCNKCDEVREVAAHMYDDEYDAHCNICDAERDVPERPGDDTPPQTGDKSMLPLWILLAVSSLAGIIAILSRKKRAEF